MPPHQPPSIKLWTNTTHFSEWAIGDDASLPVELSTFTATTSNNNIILNWRTESEVNNIGFALYRREDKEGNYTKVAFVNGAGNSAIPNEYQFTDEKTEAGKIYFYYLEDIDIAGEKSKSEIIQVVVPPAQPVPNEFRLLQNFPNPFNPETWIPYELANPAEVTIRIYNLKRQLIRTINLGHQKAGFYINKDRAAHWNGRTQTGEPASSGLYFYTIQADNFIATKQMILVK